MLYMRFMLCLALGLLGLCAVMKTLLDTLLADWDPYADLKRLLARPGPHKRHHRPADEDRRFRRGALLSARF